MTMKRFVRNLMKKIEVTGKHTGERSHDGVFVTESKIMTRMERKTGAVSGNSEYIQITMQPL
jgi:hypothetical protein